MCGNNDGAETACEACRPLLQRDLNLNVVEFSKKSQHRSESQRGHNPDHPGFHLNIFADEASSILVTCYSLAGTTARLDA